MDGQVLSFNKWLLCNIHAYVLASFVVKSDRISYPGNPHMTANHGKKDSRKRDYGELESNVIYKLSTTETNLSVYLSTRNELVKS